ncbi:hypothetical protein E8D34_19640 [Nocardioides sp. GY 10113]|uniref:ABC transporter permease subunit n=1 Tax=Nocardioides sp. GY 10113 TaxID=2569761 RepID=UPI0010A7F135|nr:ABC transporter permease subunit [Nocardioides sp. GY 10113]TIC79884.1 hypothetical protein E8D34_19640 [Nocardioides sp. GY 10113]
MSTFSRVLRVELIRLRRRRAVLVIAAAILLVPLAIGGLVAWNSRPLSDGERAEAAAQAQRDLQECIQHPRRWGAPRAADAERFCTRNIDPSPEWYIYRPTLDLRSDQTEGGAAAALVVIALALLAGTTFIGHDWASGSVSNQLLFTPRRVPVWLAKAVALAVTALAWAAVSLTAYWLLLGAVAARRDLPVGDGVLLDCLQMGWRAAVVAAGAAVGGYALTMLLRSTVGALGVIAAVAVAGGIVLAATGFSGALNPATNVDAVLRDGTRYWVDLPCGSPEDVDNNCGREELRTLGQGAGYLGSGLVVVALGSVWSFRRRDVP